MDSKLGGWSETRALWTTEEIQCLQVCDEVKGRVEEKTKEKYVVFRAFEYRKEIVNGTNFLIKVHVGGENCIHLLVFQALPCNGGEVELLGVQKHKIDDPLEPF